MQEAAIPLLLSWQNFYVIVGSAAATLTGLMFVVITLVTGAQKQRSNDSLGAFGTPTLVHLCSTLLIAVTFAAPWPALWQVALLLGLCGLAGVLYLVIVIRRARRQAEYEPVLEDWLWHTIFPLLSYSALVSAALLILSNPVLALFIVGAVSLLFLLTGIHNSWDTVTYIILKNNQPEKPRQDH